MSFKKLRDILQEKLILKIENFIVKVRKTVVKLIKYRTKTSIVNVRD